MDVPVEHQDPVHSTAGECVGGGDRDVVEQAEAHRPVPLRVVTRRSQAAEGESAVNEQALGRVGRAAGGMKRSVPGPGAGHGVEVDHPAATRRELLDRVDVSVAVHPEELFALSGGGLDQLQPQPVALRHRLLDRGQAPGALRVPAGVVLERARMSDVQPLDQGTVRFAAAMTPDDPLDVVVVGGGAAGLYSALTAADAGSRVAVVSRKPLSESSSFWAQGGLAAAIGGDDSAELHAED